MTSESDFPDSVANAGGDSLAHLRHELRTPLNQIIGYSEMLQEEAEDAGQEGFIPDLQKIQSAARTLLGTINDNLGGGASIGRRADAVAERLAVPAPGPSGVEASEARAPVTGRLLVVDDNELNRDMLSRRLERHGHSVETAENGRSALERLRREAFDLVLLDIMMPELDGYAVLERLKADASLRHVPVIMISALDEMESVIRCIEIGAEDYLPKPFNPTLLRARIGASLEKKQLRDQEQRTYQALVESQRQLASELAEAAEYVKSLLPAPLSEPLRTEWRFIPSTQLGGDSFGYHWLDREHFAMYVLDVCGHGVGAALLSISVMNVLRAQSLASTDFRVPSQVLSGLNEAFQMDNHNNMYFTIWYGVFHKTSRRLAYASGGHPPSVLIDGDRVRMLRTPGMVIGSLPGLEFSEASVEIQSGARLFIFSDGTYEIQKAEAGGAMLRVEEFAELLAESLRQPGLDWLVDEARRIQGRDSFDDDFSIMRIDF